jgi:hypothetical protein
MNIIVSFLPFADYEPDENDPFSHNYLSPASQAAIDLR